jgi:hypothetical protein
MQKVVALNVLSASIMAIQYMGEALVEAGGRTPWLAPMLNRTIKLYVALSAYRAEWAHAQSATSFSRSQLESNRKSLMIM